MYGQGLPPMRSKVRNAHCEANSQCARPLLPKAQLSLTRSLASSLSRALSLARVLFLSRARSLLLKPSSHSPALRREKCRLPSCTRPAQGRGAGGREVGRKRGVSVCVCQRVRSFCAERRVGRQTSRHADGQTDGRTEMVVAPAGQHVYSSYDSLCLAHVSVPPPPLSQS